MGDLLIITRNAMPNIVDLGVGGGVGVWKAEQQLRSP